MVKESEIDAIKKHLDGENTIDCLNNALLQLFNEKELIDSQKIEDPANMTIKNNNTAQRKSNETARFVKYDLTFFIGLWMFIFIMDQELLKNLKQVLDFKG